LTTLIKGFTKKKRMDKAINIYNYMSQSDTNLAKPTKVTYNSLLDCCVRCDDLEKAN